MNSEIRASVGMAVTFIGLGCGSVFFADIFVELKRRGIAKDSFSLLGLPNTPKLYIISGIVLLVIGGVYLMCVIAEYSFAKVTGSLI